MIDKLVLSFKFSWPSELFKNSLSFFLSLQTIKRIEREIEE